MVKSFGLPELVVTSYEAYESLARGLAHDADRLQNLRERLRAGIAQEQQSGSESRFALALMHRLTEMYQHHIRARA